MTDNTKPGGQHQNNLLLHVGSWQNIDTMQQSNESMNDFEGIDACQEDGGAGGMEGFELM